MIDISITIPVFNEEKTLASNILTLLSFLKKLPYFFEIVIVDNGSDDGTLAEVRRVKNLYPELIKVIHLELRGRGRALKESWMLSKAKLVGYMDVDLSTNLNTFPVLIKEIIEKDNDIAIGSRLLIESSTKRSLKREILSRTYNFLVKVLFKDNITDHQCGFKLMKSSAARKILPEIENNNWFFDTELLIIAKRDGYRVSEVPVQWIEDLDSRVNLIPTVIEDFRGLIRMKF